MRSTTKSRRAPRGSTGVPHAAPPGAAPAPILDLPSDAEAPFAEGAADTIDADLRHRLVSEAAFHHLEERGFAEGSELEDWAEAEAEVDHTLIHPAPPTRGRD